MSDSFVQVAPDGGGKQLDTELVQTSVSNAINTQRVRATGTTQDVLDQLYTLNIQKLANLRAIYANLLQAPGITQVTVGSALYPVTSAEISAGVTPVNLQYMTAPFLDARRYGVVADNATDNAQALSNFCAVLKQTPGTTGILPSGFILCSSLTAIALNSTIGVTIYGGSALNQTVLVYTGIGAGNFIDARSSFGFSLNYVTLDHTNSGFTGNLISFSHDSSGTDAQQGHLFRVAMGRAGVQSVWTAVGVQLDKATLITIENCDFGVLLQPISGQNTAGGSYSVGHRILNCQFNNYNNYAIAFGGQGWQISGCNFQPNKNNATNIITSNVNTTWDTLSFTYNHVLDATASSTCFVFFAVNGLEFSGNVGGSGNSSTGVFIQTNGIVNGFSMRGNHISASNFAITVVNLNHNGWSITGNFFDSMGTNAIDHPEHVTAYNAEGNFPNIGGLTYTADGPTTGSVAIAAPATALFALTVSGVSNSGVMTLQGSGNATYMRVQRSGSSSGFIGSADAVVTNPTGNSGNFAIQAVNGFDIATNGGTPFFHITSAGDLVQTRGVAVCLRATSIEQRTSTTTLTNSTQLTYAIPAAGTFEFELTIYHYFTTAVTDGITANVNYSGTFTAVGSYLMGYLMNGTTTTTGIQPVEVSATVNNALAGLTLATYGAGVAAATPAIYKLKGQLIATGTGTLAFAFAQSTSGVDSANLGVGSYMKVTQLS